MTTAGVPSRNWRAAFAAALLLCVPLALQGCGASSYAGIPLAAGAADPELQDLARRARAGDAHAQLELGIRFEEGRGVPVHMRRARKLYLRAASGTGSSRIMHVPASSGSGRAAIPVSLGQSGAGLAEARRRLHAISRLADRKPRPQTRRPGPASSNRGGRL